MKTCELFKKKTTLSFEVFPPKSSTPVESIYSTISQLQPLNPDFISVTYGAGGSTNNATIDICSAIKNHHKIESVAHLPCLYQTKERVLEQLEEISTSFDGVERAYAIQAGREVRVMVKPDVINDERMPYIAHEIAKKIESEMEYPGQIKVNIIRESRASDIAK